MSKKQTTKSINFSVITGRMHELRGQMTELQRSHNNTNAIRAVGITAEYNALKTTLKALGYEGEAI